MSIAVKVLKRELAEQQEKLSALIKDHRETIEAGKHAEQTVAAQRRHVEEIARGIETIEKVEHVSRQGVVG